MRRSTNHHVIPSALLAAMTILLASCFTLESTFTISDDGTVDLEVISLIDTEKLSDIAETFGGDFGDFGDFGDLSGPDLLEELTEGEDPCGNLVDSLLDYEVDTREIDEGTMVGVGCTVRDVPIEDLTDLGTDSFLTIEQDDSGTRFELVLEGADELTGGGEGDIDIGALLGIDLDELFAIQFSASAPGSLSDNNATSTDGATATWLLTTDAAFVVDGTATMSASWVAATSGSSSVGLIIAAIVLAIFAIGIIVFLILRRSRGKDNSSPDDVAPSPVNAPPGAHTSAPPPAPPSSPDGPPSSPASSAPLAPPPGAQPPPEPPAAMPPPPPPAD